MPVHLLRTIEDLEKHQSSWAGLSPASPLAGWHFVHEWFIRNKRSAEPFVIAYTDSQGSLEAVVPWALVPGQFGSRILTGVGREESHHDPFGVSQQGCERIRGHVIQYLRQERGAWDLLSLKLRRDSSGKLIEELSQLGCLFGAELPSAHHSLVALSGGWDEYWETKARHFKEEMRLARKLAKSPHRYRVADSGSLQQVLDALFRLHSAKLGALCDWSDRYSFIRGLCERAVPSGEAVLVALEIEGQTAAVDLMLRSGNAAIGMMRAYDPTYGKLAVGMQLTLWALERLARDGVRLVDLGVGQNPWKERFQNGSVHTVSIQVPASLKGLVVLDWGRVVRHWSLRVPLARSSYERLRDVSVSLRGGKVQAPAAPIREP